MGRKKQGAFQRANLVEEATGHDVESSGKETEGTAITKKSVKVLPKKVPKKALPKLALPKQALPKPGLGTESGSESETESLSEDDLIEGLNNMTIGKPPSQPTYVPGHILDLVMYQEMLMNIPPNAHPSVKEFLTSKFLEFVQVTHVNTEDLQKFLPLITKEDIAARLEHVSAKAETSFALILTPPVICCFQVKIV